MTLLIGLALLVIIPCVSAAPTLKELPAGQTIRVTAETGETYIRWEWKSDTSGALPLTTIYLDTDTNATKTNYELNYLYQSNLNPNEKHEIRIYDSNTSTQLGRATVTTSTPAGVAYFLIAVCLVLTFATILLSGERVVSLLVGIFTIGLSTVAMAMIHGYPELPWILTGVIVLTGAFMIIYVVKPMAEEHLKWW